ncbi:hypothetical protein GX411_02935 [Candidatus Fermentibacteria bacterium]|nr:hypothetical protein [Candidatus Fermentibacteria bacterium]
MFDGLLFELILSVVAAHLVMVPLGIKWQFRPLQIVARALFMSMICLVALMLLPDEWGLWIRFAAGVCLAILQIPLVILPFLYADPERAVKIAEDIVLSPADGRIIYVKKSTKGVLPLGEKRGETFELRELLGISGFDDDCILVGITMNFLDVHVNRAPVTGVLTRITDAGDSYLSLRKPLAVIRNSRRTSIFESGNCSVAVVQIASRMVRRIVGFHKEGTRIGQGDRFGMIRLGSQVDVAVPGSQVEDVLVSKGDLVVAGVTPLMRLAGIHRNDRGTE